VREARRAKEQGDLVAVGAVDDKLGQSRSVENVDDFYQVFGWFLLCNRNVEESQRWDVKPIFVCGHVAQVELQMLQQGALRRNRGKIANI
jgi:hypothetical protein